MTLLEQDSFHQRFEDAAPEVKTHLAEIAAANHNVVPSRFLGEALEHLLLSPGQPTPDQWPSGFGDFGPSHIVAKHAINLLESDPRDAQAWLNKLPEGKIRQEAMQNAALHWSNFDPKASEAWVQSMREAERKSVSEFVKSYRSR
ncbi:MAG: hypothetical protein ACJAVK_002602 [Akkermansiaceae bacterium]|jgi:hypothetical protein